MSVFEAVADPTRRTILECLRTDGPATLSAIAEHLPMSRQAVTKHLDILWRAGLVTMHRDGRNRVHQLRPEPLEEVEDWLAPYAEAWDRRLGRLKKHLGEEESAG